MSNVWLIVTREFNERVRKKSFIVTTLLMPVLMLGLMMAPALMMRYASGDTKTVVVIDRSGLVAQHLANSDAVRFETSELPRRHRAARDDRQVRRARDRGRRARRSLRRAALRQLRLVGDARGEPAQTDRRGARTREAARIQHREPRRHTGRREDRRQDAGRAQRRERAVVGLVGPSPRCSGWGSAWCSTCS